jgi:hypothetical protein
MEAIGAGLVRGVGCVLLGVHGAGWVAHDEGYPSQHQQVGSSLTRIQPPWDDTSLGLPEVTCSLTSYACIRFWC